jgi:Flp pilus assembly protein TadG
MKRYKAMSVLKSISGESAAASGWPIPRKSRISRGQSAVEFAMISVVALLVMLIGIQYALIGQAAVAVGQGSAAVARYAAANPGNVVASGKNPANGTVPLTAGSPIEQLLPSSILTTTTTGSGKKAVTTNDLTVTIASTSAGGGTTNAPAFGDQVKVTLSYKATSKIVLPNPFLLGISFPDTLAAASTQMYECCK